MNQLPISEVLQKQTKSTEDIYFIHEKIQDLRFFQDLFTQNHKTIDLDSIMTFCQKFQYEKFSIGDLVFQHGDSLNNKFYVILSGQVNVVKPPTEIKTPKIDIMNMSNQRELIKPVAANEPGPDNKAADAISKVLNASFRAKDSPKSTSEKNPSSPMTLIRSGKGPTSPKSSLFKSTLDNIDQSNEEKDSRPKRRFRKLGHMLGAITAMKAKSNEEKHQEEPALNVEAEKELEPVVEKEEIDVEKIKEEENKIVYNDPRKFNEYASKFGVIEKSLYKGDCFGEIEDGKITSASATLLCRTDCEFIVGTRQQFDDLFKKRNLQREVFFKELFPFLRTVMPRRALLLQFLSLFKIETFSKGAYLTIEGKNDGKDPKIFFISKGECLVEKNIQADRNNMPESPSRKSPSIVIGLVGQGMIVGEEVLATENEYSYNVKVLSETVHVYSIAKQLFVDNCGKEFQKHILGIYQRRKKQRENIANNAKKEHESNINLQKIESVQNLRRPQSKLLLNNSSMQALSIQIQQEQETLEVHESLSNNFFTASLSPSIDKSPSVSPTKLLADNEEEVDDEATSPVRTKTFLKDRRRLVKNIDIWNPREDSQYVTSKIAFLSQMPESPIPMNEPPPIKLPEELKLFPEKDPRKRRYPYLTLNKATTQKPVSPVSLLKKGQVERLSVDVILNGLNKRTKRKFKLLSPEKTGSKIASIVVQDKTTVTETNLRASSKSPISNLLQTSFRDTIQSRNMLSPSPTAAAVPFRRRNFITQPGSPNETSSFHNLYLNSSGSLNNSRENTGTYYGEISPLQNTAGASDPLFVMDSVGDDQSFSGLSPKYANSPGILGFFKSTNQARRRNFREPSKRGSPKTVYPPQQQVYKMPVARVVIIDSEADKLKSRKETQRKMKDGRKSIIS